MNNEVNYYKWITSNSSTKTFIELKEYNGESDIKLKCTQLDKTSYPTESSRKKILNEWIQFFVQYPNALKRLYVTTKINQELFDAICNQGNLEELIISWGVYPDLTAIKKLHHLKSLSICGAASHKDLSPISALTTLENLNLQNFIGTTDYSVISSLNNLKHLGLHSAMYGVIKVENLDFLKKTRHLKNFSTTGFRLLNHDYSPILELDELEYLSVNMPSCDWHKWNNIFAKHFAHIKCNKHKILE